MNWQPISSAPKNGEVILLFCSESRLGAYGPSNRHKKRFCIGYNERGHWETGTPGGHGSGGGDGQFTHWAPISDPEV